VTKAVDDVEGGYLTPVSKLKKGEIHSCSACSCDEN